MADALDALQDHLGGAGIVVWAHNSHVGDARATSMGTERGELNLGQLARERHPGDVCIVGFTTRAAPSRRRATGERRPSAGSSARASRARSSACCMRRASNAASSSCARAGSTTGCCRMTGVIYRPESERRSHYVEVLAARRFDVLLHVDETSAAQPLEPWPVVEEPAETYPSEL